MLHRAVVVDHGGKAPHVNREVLDELLASLRVGGVELERDAVARQHVTQLVAARGPLLADDSVHHMTRPMRDRPGRERLLDLRVEPLLRGDPSLHDREVDLSQRGRALKRRQVGQRDPRVVPIHGHQQHAPGTGMERVGSFEELNAVHAGQLQVGCHQRHLAAVVCQSLQLGQRVLGVCRRRVPGSHGRSGGPARLRPRDGPADRRPR